MVQEQTDHRLPTYISYATFVTCLDWLKDMGTTPSRIDRSLWEPKFAGSVGAQLMPGLRFLGLLEGDVPMDKLANLAGANNDQRKALLAEMLRDAYGADLVDGLRSMTPKMLDDALTNLGATDPTRRKAASFLINAARAADLPIASHISKRARNRAPVKKTATGDTKGKRRQQSKPDQTNRPHPPSGDGHTRLLKLRSGGRVSLTVDFNPFDLEGEDRVFVFALIDQMKEYEVPQASSEEAE